MIVHAQFSTDEQRQTSLDDQIAVCRQFLDQSLPKGWSPTQVEIRDIREPEISGKIADRPGINEDWPDRLHFAQSHHSRANFYTRRRISRAHDGLWARGVAVGNTVIGYRRRPTG